MENGPSREDGAVNGMPRREVAPPSDAAEPALPGRWRRLLEGKARSAAGAGLSFQLLFQVVQHLVAVEHLAHAGVRLPAFLYGGEELAVPPPHAVHGNGPFRS